MKYNFGGYATRYGVRCADRRLIHKGSFAHQDGEVIPLVWQHMRNDPENVLGHALLESRDDGMYAYVSFNKNPKAMEAKEAVEHGDLKSLSIFANRLTETENSFGKDVTKGTIREVSLVLSGANPGAFIDNVVIEHADGSQEEDPDSIIIYSGEGLEHMEYEDDKDPKNDEIKHEDNDPTVEDVLNTLNEDQKLAVYAVITNALQNVEHSDEKGDDHMKYNVFEGEPKQKDTLTHDEFQAIMDGARSGDGSLKKAFMEHKTTYGIENIDILFPDAKPVRNTPDWIKRETDWVQGVLNGCHHSPFSRIKSMAADITADTARALGYIKGKTKKEEYFSMSKRITTPQTIYKKQKLDRDDIIDITDLDVVAWIKGEMRMMLDEEIARAILLGDGRDPETQADDKIQEKYIRPIWNEEELYVHYVDIEEDAYDPKTLPEMILRNMSEYKGTGSPRLFTDNKHKVDMLLVKDSIGRRYYNTDAELASALGVSGITEVPLFDVTKREVESDEKYGEGSKKVTYKPIGIIVNLADYTIGSDKGGQISMFDDFDIDVNQYKYLMETRISGCLTRPKSAVVIRTYKVDEAV